MKTQLLITPQSVKRAAKHVARPDKLVGNGKHVNTRQAMDSYGSGARIRLSHYPHVPSQYRGDGLWVKDKRGYGLTVGKRRKLILGFQPKSFREMSC